MALPVDKFSIQDDQGEVELRSVVNDVTMMRRRG